MAQKTETAMAMPERWGVRRAPGVNAYILTAPEGDETLVDRPLVVRFLDDLAASHARVATALAQAERSQGEPDRWREAVQSAAEAMDKAKKLLIVAGLQMEGGTISQPYNTALEGLRALLANAASPPQTERSQCGVPEGWTICRKGREISVCAPDMDPGAVTLSPETVGKAENRWLSVSEQLLFALADALLSAAPAPDAAASENVSLPDPWNCRACTHPDCGRYDGPRFVECRAMQFGACAREYTFATDSPKPEPDCTCPSGDGSLRHPCPKHPPSSPGDALSLNSGAESSVSRVPDAEAAPVVKQALTAPQACVDNASALADEIDALLDKHKALFDIQGTFSYLAAYTDWESVAGKFVSSNGGEIAALLRLAGTQQQCCMCGRWFDAREQSEGGGPDGAQLTDGRWACSPDCWESASAQQPSAPANYPANPESSFSETRDGGSDDA